MPLYIADYVLMNYGTGAVMGVPAHDERDFAFAKSKNLPIVEVITPDGKSQGELKEAYTATGVMINSGQFDGQPSDKAKENMIAWAADNGYGKRKSIIVCAIGSFRARDIGAVLFRLYFVQIADLPQ